MSACQPSPLSNLSKWWLTEKKKQVAAASNGARALLAGWAFVVVDCCCCPSWHSYCTSWFLTLTHSERKWQSGSFALTQRCGALSLSEATASAPTRAGCAQARARAAWGTPSIMPGGALLHQKEQPLSFLIL